jgi:acetyltransferase-like isoleucine patch superfamily enzyme
MTIKEYLQIKLRSPLRPIIRFLMFFLYDTYYVAGGSGKLIIGERCGLANTYFNLSSGNITIGDNTIFSVNVMVITGRHKFSDGCRASLAPGLISRSIGGGSEEVPENGFDINIGSGTWIAAGVIVSGGVRIGDNALIAANAVVTRDIPDFAIAAGVPAKVIGDTRFNVS